MDAAGHIALVEHQLAQLGAAFALSVALGRLLVLPPIVCGYDKVTPRKQSLSPRLHRCVASSTDPQPLSAPLHMALTWSLVSRDVAQADERLLGRLAHAHLARARALP